MQGYVDQLSKKMKHAQRTIKEICSLLLMAAIIAGLGQFLPGLAVLFDNYLVGFVLAAIAIPVFRRIYRSHMDRIAKLPPDVRAKKEKETRERWEETCKATFSPSRPLDLRNVTNHDPSIK